MDGLVTAFQYMIFVLNYIGCSAILYAFHKSRSQKMGKYKYFFLVGTIIDLFITFGFTLLQLRAAFTTTAALLTATGWLCCTPISLPLGWLIVGAVIASLLLVVYNFMYRFAVQTRFPFIQPFLKPWFFTLIVLIPCVLTPQFSGMVYACFGPDFELPTVQAFLAERGQYPDEPPAYILYSDAAYQCSFYLYHSNNASDSETYGSLAVLGSQGTPRRPIVITKHVKDLPHVPPGLGELYRESSPFICRQVLLTESIFAVFGCFGVITFCSFCISLELYYWKSNLSAVTLRLHKKFLLLLFCQVMSCSAFLCFPVFTAACALTIGFTYSEAFAHFLLVLVNMGALSNIILIFSFVPEYRRQIYGLKKRTTMISVTNSFIK